MLQRTDLFKLNHLKLLVRNTIKSYDKSIIGKTISTVNENAVFPFNKYGLQST